MRADVMESVEKYVDEVWEDVVSDIASLVACPSVADDSAAEPGATRSIAAWASPSAWGTR